MDAQETKGSVLQVWNGQRQSISCLLSDEKVALNKFSIRNRGVGGRKKFNRRGYPTVEETKRSWNNGGAELLLCCEDPAMPHSDILPLPTLTLGAHRRTVSASVFPTLWAASVTSQPRATSSYPWIIIFMKLSMQSHFLALHPWYVVGFLGVTLRGDSCRGGTGAKAEERSPCSESSWSGSLAGKYKAGPLTVLLSHNCGCYQRTVATARCDLQSSACCSSSAGWSSMN